MSSVSFALSFVRILPKVRVVYDSRAAILEEFYYNNDNKKLSSYKKIKHLIQVRHEKKMLQIADKVFCVSEKLKSYHLSKNNGLNEDKFIIIPGAADANLFFNNRDLRYRIRKELNINDEIVLVYSGRLAMKWEIPEKMFQLYKCIEDRIANVTLLLITPDINIAESLRELHNLSNDQIIILKSKYKNVSDYLNAADFALLLRDDVPMNNVASPTKFAEYILCGLPVIISKGIGDFSDLVIRNEFGFVLNDLDNIQTEVPSLSDYIIDLMKNPNKYNILHTEIRSWGMKKLSKDIYVNKISNIINSI
jgi:glycosyltransferase involved in cell wall biosynthesis